MLEISGLIKEVSALIKVATKGEMEMENLLNVAKAAPKQQTKINQLSQLLNQAQELISTSNPDWNELDDVIEDVTAMLSKLQEHDTCHVSCKGNDQEDPDLKVPDTQNVWETIEKVPNDNDPNYPYPEFLAVSAEENKLASGVAESDTVSLATLVSPAQIKYAPQRTPISGRIEMCCINLKWLDNDGFPLSKIAYMGNSGASIYKQLSHGLLRFNIVVREVAVPYKHFAKNLVEAEAFAKQTVNKERGDGSKYDMYAIVHNNVRDYSNAGRGVAHLEDTLIRTWLHEVGHLLTLKHAGKFLGYGTELEYDQYGDGSSFMGRFASHVLNAPQLYYCGWFAKEKVAQHDLGSADTRYKLEALYSTTPSDHVQAVIIPKAQDDKDLFLSVIPIRNKETGGYKNLFALHYRVDGGSQRLDVFSEKYAYKNLLFFERKTVSADGTYATVKISQRLSA